MKITNAVIPMSSIITATSAAASQQKLNPQNYRLANISEVEAYLLDEISKREKIAKKMQCFATSSNAVGNGLIAITVITDSLFISILSEGGPCLLAWLYLTCCPLVNTASQKSSQLFAVKQEKQFNQTPCPDKIRKHTRYHTQSKTNTFRLLNFLTHCKRWKNITS